MSQSNHNLKLCASLASGYTLLINIRAMRRTNTSSVLALCFGWFYVPCICWWIGLCAIHLVAGTGNLSTGIGNIPFLTQDLLDSWSKDETRTYNSSDWKQLWVKNAHLNEEPQIEGSNSDTFDDGWSLGDNKLFRPYDFEDTKI